MSTSGRKHQKARETGRGKTAQLTSQVGPALFRCPAGVGPINRQLVLRCLQQLADRCNHVLQLTEIFC